MDAASLGLGVIGVLSNAVDWPKYVHAGKNYDGDYQNAILRLQLSRLQLSRWGIMVGLLGEPDSAEAVHARFMEAMGSKDHVTQANKILLAIQGLYERAGQDTATIAPTRPDEEAHDRHRASDLPETARLLYNTLDAVSAERLKSTTLAHKAAWVILNKRAMTELLDESAKFIESLFQLCRYPRHDQLHLCRIEASRVGKSGCLQLLRDIAHNQDKILEEEATRAAEPKAGSYHTSISAEQNSGLMTGVNYGSFSFGMKQNDQQ